jgi:hypothetical protein
MTEKTKQKEHWKVPLCFVSWGKIEPGDVLVSFN